MTIFGVALILGGIWLIGSIIRGFIGGLRGK